MDHNIFYQDNMATIRLSERTKHINTKFLFIKDKVEDGDIEVQYCPTDKMCYDVLNKLKQGTPFQLDCSYLQNLLVDYNYDGDCMVKC